MSAAMAGPATIIACAKLNVSRFMEASLTDRIYHQLHGMLLPDCNTRVLKVAMLPNID
jgi:hypothetical protein